MWWKQHKWKVLIPALIAAVLVFAFWYGGDAPDARGWNPGAGQQTAQALHETEEPNTPDETAASEQAQSPEPAEKAAETPDTPEEPAVEAKTEDKAQETAAQKAAPQESAEPKAEESKPAEQKPEAPKAAAPKAAAKAAAPKKAEAKPEASKPETAKTEAQPTMEINLETGKDKYLTDPVPEGKPLPVEPENQQISTTEHTCTLSISCSTILDNLDLCDADKVELVPEDGWILAPTAVTFYEGESVFNVLQRVCKQNQIHMEFEDTPIYNSAYIEGIHNLYEFDVGELSGWMYKVNGWFPNYGCSRYQLQDGDTVDWVYTCDLGKDVGRSDP